MDARANNGTTPLYGASLNGHALVVCELLSHGANPNARMNDGWTPLHAAADKGHIDAMRELMCKPETDVNARGDDGRTPLMSRAQRLS